MSTRASLSSEANGKRKEIAESEDWIPVCWLGLLSSADIEGTEHGQISLDRKSAIERCASAVPFLSKLFPEYESLEQKTSDLLAHLKKVRSKTLEMDLGDHFAIREDVFPAVLEAAVKAIEVQKEDCEFTRPAREAKNPFTGKPIKIKATKCKSTREVICFATNTSPEANDEEVEPYFLVGHLWK